MQLVVVGSKLKRLPIHLIYGTNGREQRISGRFPILGMTHRDYNSNTFKMFLYQCNLITHNMGEKLCMQLNTHEDAYRITKRLQEYKPIKQHCVISGADPGFFE